MAPAVDPAAGAAALAWLVTWQSLGRECQARFRTAVGAEAWREQQHGEKRALVACTGGAVPVAWLICYGPDWRHSWITDADQTAATLQAARVHGRLTPLMLAPQ